MNTPPTLALLADARGGNTDAASALFARHLPRVREIARARLGAVARMRWALDSQDVLQEALTRAYRGLEQVTVSREGQFVLWMATVVENTIRDMARAAGRQKRDEARKQHAADDWFGGVAHTGPTPSEVAMGKELADLYFDTLAGLEERKREAILLRKHADASFAEIAADLGLAGEAQARTLLSRALAELAAGMDSRRGGLGASPAS